MKYHSIMWELRTLMAMRRCAMWKLSGESALFGQLPALEAVIRHEGCTQRVICEALICSPASVAQTCKRLEQAGYIERRVDPSDRRSNKLYATELGMEAAKKARENWDRVDELMFGGLSEAELSTFTALIAKIKEHMGGEGDYRLPHSPFSEENT